MPEEFYPPITVFDDEYRFLSNFFIHSFEWRGIEWATSEHAFQATKTITDEDMEYVKSSRTPGVSKRRGREIQCRDDWDEIKSFVMIDILRSKFSEDSPLTALLLKTGEAELVEGNKWHDNTWGNCTCSKRQSCNGHGKNLLGDILMQIRSERRETDAT